MSQPLTQHYGIGATYGIVGGLLLVLAFGIAYGSWDGKKSEISG